MAIPFDPYFQITETADLFLIQAARDFTLTQGSADPDVVNVPRDRDLVVFADKVTIKGKIEIPVTTASPKRLTIVARHIDASLGAELCVNGVDAGAPVHPRADNGRDGNIGDGARTHEEPGKDGESPFDTSGKVDPDHAMNGKNGTSGEPGCPGGIVLMLCQSFAPGSRLIIRAEGGAGGVAQAGGNGGKGGKGGDGADEETHWYWLNPSPATLGGRGGRGGDGGTGGVGGKGGPAGSIMVAVVDGDVSTDLKCDAGAGGVVPKEGNGGCAGRPGDPGDGGWYTPTINNRAGAPPTRLTKPSWEGSEGRPGTSGTSGESGTTPTDLKPILKKSATYADLSHNLTNSPAGQLRMMLDRIRVDYLSGYTGRKADMSGDIVARLRWIKNFVDEYDAATGENTDEAKEMSAASAAAYTLIDRLKHGKDYYGNLPGHVPLGSIDFYKNQADLTLELLVQLQNCYNNHITALDQHDKDSVAWAAAVEHVSKLKSAADNASANGRIQIAKLQDSIAKAQSEVDAAESVLTADKDYFTAGILSSCGLTLPQFMECVGQFAFFGEHDLQQCAMIASEFSKITEQTLSNVVDSSGKSVPKSSVIESLKVINDLKGRFKQGYKQTVDGISLADPGGVRLAAQQDQVDKICEEFKDMVSAVLLEHAMDAYVAAVGGRNALIIQLNEVMSQTIEADSRAKSAGVALAAAALENGRNAAPGLCSMASQLSRALAQRRDELLLQFYYGSRAYRFWTLQAEDEFGEALAQLKLDDPLPLLPETFASVKQKMFVDRSSEIESRIGSYYSTFPPAEAATDARGVCVEISDETYPEVIKSLQTKGRAHFTLPVCRKATLKSSSGFAGFADVRISKVRAWVFGAKTKDDDLRVDLLHGGREAIVSPDDDLSIFHHPPVHVVFKHNTSIINDTESLFHGTGGAVDGVLLDQNGDAVRAPIGPFTRWDIILDKSWNDGLITGGIHRVMLEFHGFARSFSV